MLWILLAGFYFNLLRDPEMLYRDHDWNKVSIWRWPIKFRQVFYSTFDPISLFQISFDLSYPYIKPPQLIPSRLHSRVTVTLFQADCLFASQTSLSVHVKLLLNTDAVFSHTLFLKCNYCDLHNHADIMQTFDTDVWRL